MSFHRLLPSISFLKSDRRIAAGAPHPLGATWDGRGTNFALFSSTAEKVELCLFDPMGRSETVVKSIRAERKRLDPIRNVADIVLDTTKFNVHDLRARINAQFEREDAGQSLMVSSNSFGFKNGVPAEADLVFDVRFLPNPHFVPEFRKLTGKHPKVAKYVLQFSQTKEFLNKTTEMLKFLLPHYIKEGKSYLTVAFGCTGGQHRSVFIAEEIKRRLAEEGYKVKTSHRDMPR